LSSYLWIIDFTYSSRHHNGGLVRYFNYSQELISAGHSVTFAIVIERDREQSLEWMRSLRDKGVCSDFYELLVETPGWNRMASLLLPLSLERFAIRDFRRQAISAIGNLIRTSSPDVLIVSSVRFIYTAWECSQCIRIGDFCDSLALFYWRDLKLAISRGSFRAASHRLPDLLVWFFREWNVSRKYDANIFVSPVDKRIFDVMARSSARNLLLSNGVRFENSSSGVAKIPHRLIFSGVMDFAPNYDSALWFLEHVFPLVLAKIPDAVFVVAGGNPHPSLLAQVGPNVQVTGFVEDLAREIAISSLYVAPMKSGSGFKNKVAEAIASGTWVIGTPMAVEFLPAPLRELIPVHDDAGELASEICSFFDDPAPSLAKLRQLRRVLEDQFSWRARAEELHTKVQSIMTRSA